MKILIIAESFPTSQQGDLTGGVETRDFFLSLGLSQQHQVTVLTGARTGSPKKEFWDELKILRLGRKVDPEQRQSILIRLSYFVACWRLAAKLDFDIVLGSNVFTNPLAYLIAKSQNKPAVAFLADLYRGDWVELTGWITGLLGELVERVNLSLPWSGVISCSQVSKAKLVKAGLDEKLIKVIYGGVEVKTGQSIKESKLKQPTICFAGRLVKYKRVQDLIRAAAIIVQDIPDLRVVIIGDGEYRSELEKLTSQLDLDQIVEFRGFLPTHEAVLRQIKRSQLLCLPSIVEGFGHVTVEAFSCGTPVLNADLPINREITQEKAGLLFKPKDPEDLAKKAVKLLTDKPLYRKLVDQTQDVVKTYDWSSIIDQTEEYLQQVVSQAESDGQIGKK